MTALEVLAVKLAWLLFVHIECKSTLCADILYMERLGHDLNVTKCRSCRYFKAIEVDSRRALTTAQKM
jgi:hypothetical protein